MSELTASNAWKALEAQKKRLSNFNLRESFSDDPTRADTLSRSAAGLFYDFSKELVDAEALQALIKLAEQQNVPEAIRAMQQGEHINNTEDRAALHYLLRQTSAPENLAEEFKAVCNTRDKMRTSTQEVLSGSAKGATDKSFTDVIHIGIGGSYLGPEMIYQAMQVHHEKGLRCHFISNICAHELHRVLEGLNPETCLLIVASKTFTTLETLQNANTAKDWLQKALGEEATAKHFYAVTSAPDKAQAYGIEESHIFEFWDWVGGRFSSFSAIGLTLSLGLGWDIFEQLLEGAAAMDTHFFESPLDQNMPVIQALIGVWYINFFHKEVLCIAPYDSRLREFPTFLQQLEMESTGKSATKDNQPVDYATCPTLFGEPGTNCQHSYFQLLHQSPSFVPVNFIVCARPDHAHQEHRDWLFANCLAQAKALMLGQTSDKPGFEHHQHMSGNRPSSTLMMDELSPQNLGALIALYEHKVYVQSVIWSVNAFDQWGVELGKNISKGIKPKLDTGDTSDLDPSTAALIERYRAANNRPSSDKQEKIAGNK